MTRHEIRIAAAQKRVRAAEAKLSRAYEIKLAAVEAASKKYTPAISSAERAVSEARVAKKTAQLAALGITPMKTIVLWHAKYTAHSAMKRYVVRVTREGWTRLVPVGAKGRILTGRNDVDGPYESQLHKLIVTGAEIVE